MLLVHFNELTLLASILVPSVPEDEEFVQDFAR